MVKNIIEGKLQKSAFDNDLYYFHPNNPKLKLMILRFDRYGIDE
jgi:hypothetical protein